MCLQSPRPCVTAEEDIAAEECLLVYCKPVEFYNILQRRSQHNRSYLSRCLNYNIEAKRKTRLIDGFVIFNYRDQRNVLRKTEVTRQFTCPFCLMRCGSYKGLRSHLIKSHELFKCEFWTTEEYKAINVSVKTDALHSESVTDELKLRMQSFSFCSRPRKRKRPEDHLEKGNINPHFVEEALPAMATESNEGGNDPGEIVHNPRTREYCYSHENGNANGVNTATANDNLGVQVARAQSVEDTDCVQSTSADTYMSSALPPAAKSRKISSGRTKRRRTTLLHKQRFYHSQKAQPMAFEQLLSDRDSEDEADKDIADIEDKRMLDDFVDVTEDEKQLMHLWNSFVRRQRVCADGHIPWACEAFLKVHGKLLVQSTGLCWCWRLHMIKLWNHGLLDACTMNNCSMILEKLRDEASILDANKVSCWKQYKSAFELLYIS